MLRLLPLVLVLRLLAAPNSDDDWPRWRGPADDGMARGDAPVKWSDTEHVAWKYAVAGKGHSSPVIWGDTIFLTTAIPMSDPTPSDPTPPAPEPAAPAQRGRGGMRSGGAV